MATRSGLLESDDHTLMESETVDSEECRTPFAVRQNDPSFPAAETATMDDRSIVR
jgi:hypothetical protein